MNETNLWYHNLYKKSSNGKKLLYRAVHIELNPDTNTMQTTITGEVNTSSMELIPKKEHVKYHKPSKVKGSFDRAETLCNSDHEKRKKLGYFESVEEAWNTEPPKICMLVKDMMCDDIDKMGDDEFPLFEQIKLNGCRGTYHYDKNEIMSRELNPYDLPELREQCHRVCKHLGFEYLDFEIYADGFPINEIVSMVRHNDDRLECFVFDVPSNFLMHDRLNNMSKLLDFLKSHAGQPYDRIKVLTTRLVEDKGDLKFLFDQAVKNNHEGIIIRKPKGIYKWNNKTTRTDDIRKVKPVLSAEFKVVGIEWDEREVSGKSVCLVEFICETEGGEQFKVAPTSWGIEKRNDWKPEWLSEQPWRFNEVHELPYLTVEFREWTKTLKPFHVLDSVFNIDR